MNGSQFHWKLFIDNPIASGRYYRLGRLQLSFQCSWYRYLHVRCDLSRREGQWNLFAIKLVDFDLVVFYTLNAFHSFGFWSRLVSIAFWTITVAATVWTVISGMVLLSGWKVIWKSVHLLSCLGQCHYIMKKLRKSSRWTFWWLSDKTVYRQSRVSQSSSLKTEMNTAPDLFTTHYHREGSVTLPTICQQNAWPSHEFLELGWAEMIMDAVVINVIRYIDDDRKPACVHPIIGELKMHMPEHLLQPGKWFGKRELSLNSGHASL